MKKAFNPKDWIEIPNQPEPHKGPDSKSSKNADSDTDISKIESIILEIESRKLDITSDYSAWRNIGFALADKLGESGRDFFHRVSKFYPEYNPAECDKQFNNCLKSKRQGISLRTFYYYASMAGIKIAQENPKKEKSQEEIPVIPETVFPQLPEFLQKVVAVATSGEEKDLLLLGSLAAISACLPRLHGIYDGRKVYPNLFLFITAQASAGKGRLVHCKQLVNPVHKEKREEAKRLKQQYEFDIAEYNDLKHQSESAEKPGKPPEKMLFIPANNSSTGAYQLLGDSDGLGLIFETEGDTLAHAFKSDYGNYSDGFRKAFHHETISYYRRTNREYVDIENPRLSAVLSGTPKQISALIPSAENGLFSRFIFYHMNVHPHWKNVFDDSTVEGLDEYFDNLGSRYFELYKHLKESTEKKFSLTHDQQAQFHDFFTEVQDYYITLQGLDYLATIRRLGLIAFRISMILSALRIIETGEDHNLILCDDRDFKSTLSIIRVLVRHSCKIFNELPEDEKPKTRKNRKEKFLDQLPWEFNRQKYLEVASQLKIPPKTAEGYITEFAKKGIIHREKHDHYLNTSLSESHGNVE